MKTEVVIGFRGRGRKFVNKFYTRSNRVSWGGRARFFRRSWLCQNKSKRFLCQVRWATSRNRLRIGSGLVLGQVLFPENVSVRVTEGRLVTEVVAKLRVAVQQSRGRTIVA